MSEVGRTIRALVHNNQAALCDVSGHKIPNSHRRAVSRYETGTVVMVDAYNRLYHTVYPPREGDLNTAFRLIKHKFGNINSTWEFLQNSSTATLTIEQQGVMELFLASSTETIDGVVPQVKYGKVIVWQGDPVDATDKTDDEVNTEACKVAQEKINEVVKKQFT